MLNPLNFYKEEIIQDKTYLWMIAIVLFKNIIYTTIYLYHISKFIIILFFLTTLYDLIISFTLIPIILYLLYILFKIIDYVFKIK